MSQQPHVELIPLGKTDLRITPLGVGTWAWGARFLWGYGRGYADNDLKAAFDASLTAGISFFDTAEVYGRGRSEQLLGRFVREAGQPVVIATKFMPYPWRLSRGLLARSLRNSLGRMEMPSVDLYQIHWPFPPFPIEVWVDALADAVEAGLAHAAGVSNYSLSQMRRAHEALARRGVVLASNQVEYSLLNRAPERNGLLEACHEMGVTLVAYSPLAMGMLTGKYTPEKPPPGVRGRRYNRQLLERIQPLVGVMREIGQAHGDKTPAQVAINWVICKGAVPIPGAKNARQAKQNAGALGWCLTDDEVAALDVASDF